jgi:8-oxo-dGTP pyrophosphatase MutT (NUDIX family)
MIDFDFAAIGRFPSDVSMPYPPAESGVRTSAVLVPLIKEEAVWKVLFTRRSEQLADHGGQVSFPGGHVEAGDSGPLRTALREACEEIGILPEDIRTLGILDPADTRTGFRIWPVACILNWPVPMTLSLPEVREVFFVPVEWLMEPENLQWRPPDSASNKSQTRVPFFKPFQGHVIWGATAKITVRLMEILRRGIIP